MPQPYDDPSGFNSTLSVFEYANTVTDNYFGLGIIVVAWIIIFAIVRIKGYRTSQSMLVSSFLCFSFATMMWAVGLVISTIPTVFLLFSLASGIYTYLDK